MHLEKSKKALKCLDTEKIHENLEKNTEILYDNEYFTVKKINVEKEISFERKEPYILESIIKGRGEIIIDDETYPIKKGDFFIITNYTKSYSFKGNLEIVESSSK